MKTKKEIKPLKIEELKEMDGKAAYCVDSKGYGKWALVHAKDEVCTDADFGDWEFYSYGWMDSDVGWVAYNSEI